MLVIRVLQISVTDWAFTRLPCFLQINHALHALSLSFGDMFKMPSSEKSQKPHLSFTWVPTRILKITDLCCLLDSHIFFFYLPLYSMYLISLSSRVIFLRFRESNLVFCLDFIVWLTTLANFNNQGSALKPGCILNLFILWPLMGPLKGSHSIMHFG